MVAEHLAQGLVKEVGRRVVGPDRGAANRVDGEFDRLADGEPALIHGDVVDEEGAEHLLRGGDAGLETRRGYEPGIADLTAGFGVERRLVDENEAGLAGRQRLGLGTLA